MWGTNRQLRQRGSQPATESSRGWISNNEGFVTSKLIHGDAALKLLLCRRNGKWQYQRCPCLSVLQTKWPGRRTIWDSSWGKVPHVYPAER